MKNHKLFGAIVGSVIALTMSSCGKERNVRFRPLTYCFLVIDHIWDKLSDGRL